MQANQLMEKMHSLNGNRTQGRSLGSSVPRIPEIRLKWIISSSSRNLRDSREANGECCILQDTSIIGNFKLKVRYSETIFTSNMFSLHSREISLGVRTGRDFKGDEGT